MTGPGLSEAVTRRGVLQGVALAAAVGGAPALHAQEALVERHRLWPEGLPKGLPVALRFATRIVRNPVRPRIAPLPA